MKNEATVTKLGDFLKALEGTEENLVVILEMFNSMSQFSRDNFLKCYHEGLICPSDENMMIEILGGDIDGLETVESRKLRRDVRETLPSGYVFELAKLLFDSELTETECGCIWYHSPECRKTHFARARVAVTYFGK